MTQTDETLDDVKGMSAGDLRSRYRELMAMQQNETFDSSHVLQFLRIVVELGRRGYRLNDSETDWK